MPRVPSPTTAIRHPPITINAIAVAKLSLSNQAIFDGRTDGRTTEDGGRTDGRRRTTEDGGRRTTDGRRRIVLGTWYLVLGTCYREAVLTRRKGFQCNTAFPPPSPWFFGVCRSFCSDYLRGEKHTLIKISDSTYVERCKSVKDQMSKGKSFMYEWVNVSIVGCCSLFVVCWLWVVGYWLLVLSFWCFF